MLPLNLLTPTDEHSPYALADLFVAENEQLQCLKPAEAFEAPVLVVQELKQGSTFIIECLDANIFSISRVAQHVTLPMLETLQLPDPSAEYRSLVHFGDAQCERFSWWHAVSLQGKNTLEPGASEIEGQALNNDYGGREQDLTFNLAESSELKKVEKFERVEQDLSNSPEHALEVIRQQYQEALYSSRVNIWVVTANFADVFRHHWHTLQRVLSRVRELVIKDCLDLEYTAHTSSIILRV